MKKEGERTAKQKDPDACLLHLSKDCICAKRYIQDVVLCVGLTS